MRIRQLRKENKLRQADVAKILDVTPEAYSMWENGVRQIGLAHLIKLAEFYGVTLEYLVGTSSQPKSAESLNADENALLMHFARLDEADKGLVLAMARNLAANKKYEDRLR